MQVVSEVSKLSAKVSEKISEKMCVVSQESEASGLCKEIQEVSEVS